jgi:hypothetical protein
MKGRAVSVAMASCLACWALLALGCDGVSSGNIQRWKGTEKGPRKLENALVDSKVSPRLRAEAAVALMDIGQGETVEQRLAGLAPADRGAVATELIPLYAGVLQSGSVTQAREARDGLFSLRGQLPGPQQQAIDAVLVPALAKELRAGRVAGGRHSMEKILQTQGPAAGPMLLQLLEDPAAPYLPVVDLLAKVADPETREKAGAALVRRAASQPSIPPQLWRALGMLGGKPCTDFLQEKAEKGHERDAVLASQALQQGPKNPGLVPFAMRLAGDQRASRQVRDEMFGLLEYIGTPEAADGAVRVIATDPDALVRYRAYETAVAIGKEGVVPAALEAFPAAATYKREDVVDFLVKDIQKLGPPARAVLPKLLASKSALARMTGLLAYESIGTPADVVEVNKLTGDRAAIRGFPPATGIGREAARISGILQGRADGGKP